MQAIYDTGAPAPCPDPFNMAAHVLAHADACSDRVALAVVGPTGAERWSYARLKEVVLGTAGGLLAQGLAPGDRVLLRLGNTVDFPIAYLASIAAGLVPVPTSAQLTRAEITRMAGPVAPRLILAAPDVALPDGDTPVLSLEALRALRDHAPAAFHMGSPERPAFAVFSSGTSARPQAVLHAHRSIWARRMMIDHWYALGPGDRLMHAGAFNWTYTMGTGLMDPWSVGATALIPAADVTPSMIPLLLQRHDVTVFAAAPGIYRQLLKSDANLALRRLRHGLSAGEKLASSLHDAWRAATGTAIHEAFGMSECSTFISGNPADPAPAGTLGRPQPGRRVAILGTDGAPVARGERGVIAVSRRDPGLMLGYLDAPEATARRMSGEWFRTGDIGSMDESGAVTYLGREDDMMNAGGFRVSPVEVEEALIACRGITDAAAVELRVAKDTTIIAAFYTADDDPGEAAILGHCAERLARYKQPRLARRVAVLPRGGNGKLLRRQLRQDHEEHADDQA